MLRPLLEVEMMKHCTPLLREAHLEVKMLKTPHVRATFGRWSVVLCGGRKGFCTLRKVSKTWGFCGSFKNVGKRRTCEEDLERCISRGRRSTRDMVSRDVRRSERWFPQRSCILEHQIFRFAKMFCVTGATLRMAWPHFFVASAILYTHELEKSQNALVQGRRICTQLSIIEGSLAELLRFWHCQVQNLRKSRRFFVLLMLSSWKVEDVSQNSFVFNLADR